MENLEVFLQKAIEIAKRAGEIQLMYFRKNGLEMSNKSNEYDLVTEADKNTEKEIVDIIHGLYPTHGVLSEESGELSDGIDYRWVIDPLDGTTNFSQGLPVFCVSIALEYKEKAVVGVVYAPYLGELFYAMEGRGAFLNGKPIRCSDKTRMEECVVATGFPYDKGVNPDNNLKELSRITLKVRGLRRMGSAAIDLCYVAASYYDAFWELNLNRWDVAAGILIAKEAGARLYSIRENRNHSVLMAGPGIADKMLELLLTPTLHNDFH